MHSRMRFLRRRHFRKSIIYSLVCCLTLNASLPALMALESGNIIGSSGIIGDPTWGDHTIIDTQNGSIIDWNNFNTSGSQSVRFRQYDGPSPSNISAVLNRIHSGTAPTRFDGALSANGRVFVVNPAGVIFGAGSTVHVSQLVASGLSMSNDAFAMALADESNRMIFAGGGGDIVNNGTITAGNSVYLVGENVTNTGTILCPGGLVVMAAGNRLQLGQLSSNIIVDVGTDLVAGNSDSVINSGAVGEPGSAVASLVLAAGDVFSQAIANVADVAAISRADVELGDIAATGSVRAYSGQLADTSSSLRVNGNITAGSISLQAGDAANQTNGNHHLTVAADSILHSTVGDIVLSAHEHVTLGGDAIADDGSIFAAADSDMLGMGDLFTLGLDAPNGDIELKGRNVVVGGAANAGGGITMTGLEDTGWGGGTVHTAGTLTTGDGDIEIMVKETWRKASQGGETDDYWADGSILIEDDVTAGGAGQIRLHNDTLLAAGKTLRSGADTTPDPDGDGNTGTSVLEDGAELLLTNLQRLWQLGAKLRYQTEDEPADAPTDQQSVQASAVPIPDEPQLEISGCPALTKWAARELGAGGGTPQISIANSTASAGSTPPCDACASLKRTAMILRDYAGTHIAALSDAIRESASDGSPLSEEQEAALIVAIADGAGSNPEYALAKEYLDALAEYVGILDNDMSFSAVESAEFVMDKYIAPLAEDQNVALVTFLVRSLTNQRGS